MECILLSMKRKWKNNFIIKEELDAYGSNKNIKCIHNYVECTYKINNIILYVHTRDFY